MLLLPLLPRLAMTLQLMLLLLLLLLLMPPPPPMKLVPR
jgi:hypothetical protein